MKKNTKKQSNQNNNGKLFIIVIAAIAIAGFMFVKLNDYEATGVESKTEVAKPQTEAIIAQEAVPEPVKAPAIQEEKQEPIIARIDISTPLINANEPQFEVYINGSEQPLKQTGWMPNFNVQGNVIQQQGESLDINIKPLVDADITITLRGRWEKDNNGNMVEHWVKYNSLMINGMETLPEAKNVWHNKPFKHTINAQAGEEYKVHVEWAKSDMNHND